MTTTGTDAPRRLVGAGSLGVAAACVGVLVLTTMAAPPLTPMPVDPFWLAFAGLPLAGAYLVAKRPGNAVGKVVLAIGVLAALSAGTGLAVSLDWPRPDLFALGNQVAFLPVFVLVPTLLLVFPEGTLPSPRWVRGVAGAGALCACLMAWFVIRPVEYTFDNLTFFPNPFGIEMLAAADGAVIGLCQAGLVLFGLAAAVQAVVRYRRSGLVRRLQVKWVLVPAIVTPIVFLLVIAFESTIRSETANVLLMAGLVGGGNGVALGMAVAVLKHNLYEIERIISRTITYALVVGLLALSSLSLVAGLAWLLPSDDPLLVALATLLAFVLFNPIRIRVQAAVERRFNRARYVLGSTLDDFAQSLRDRIDPERVVDDWVGVVRKTMEPARLGVWVR